MFLKYDENNVKISKSRKLRIKYEIKRLDEIQTFLEKNITKDSSKNCKIKTISKTISFLQIQKLI